jgi:hypothetical protein
LGSGHLPRSEIDRHPIRAAVIQVQDELVVQVRVDALDLAPVAHRNVLVSGQGPQERIPNAAIVGRGFEGVE